MRPTSPPVFAPEPIPVADSDRYVINLPHVSGRIRLIVGFLQPGEVRRPERALYLDLGGATIRLEILEIA